MNSLQAAELMPVCWVIGPNVPTSAVDHLRSMGIQVEMAEEVPDQAQWVVPSIIFCINDYEPRVFRGWRPTDSFSCPRWPSGCLLHRNPNGWSEKTAERTVSAFNFSNPIRVSPGLTTDDPFEQALEILPSLAPPAVMLLTKNWTEADQLLEMASNAQFQETIFASPSVDALAELAGEFGQIATLRSPFRPSEAPMPWLEPNHGAMTLTSIDLLNPHAFSNAIGHAIWLLNHDLSQYKRRVPVNRKAWGHIQNFHPKQAQVRLGLLFASQKDADLARELVADRSEMIVLSWEADAFGKFISQVNPRRIFFEPGLIHFPECPGLSPHEDSDLSARVNVGLSFSGTDLGLLPSNWKAAGLDSLFQGTSSKTDPDPSPFVRLFSLLQKALSTTSECRFQFHLDGGWTVETDHAAFQWSPSRQLLRGQGHSAPWNHRIFTETTPRCLNFCTHFPQAQDDVDQPIVNRPTFVYQEFTSSTQTPNQRIYSGPVA